MGCCGQKRANFRATSSQAEVTTPRATQPAVNKQIAAGPAVAVPAASYLSNYAMVSLHYLESSPIQVKGTVTNRFYEFSRTNPDQSVDARDAEALLHTRFFRRNR